MANSQKKQIEMVLGHDGNRWTLTDSSIFLAAESLDELDRKLESILQPQWEAGTIEVLMLSDNEMIPGWMRPYMNHYFNRILELPLKG